LAAATQAEKQAAGATATSTLDLTVVKGKIIQMGWHLTKEGYSQATIHNYMEYLTLLVKRGADLLDAEDVKDKIARQESWSASSKNQAAASYTIFASLEKLTAWEPPIYRTARKLPFIPLESEIDALIAMGNKRMATILQLLKESGTRIGEALRLRWIDVDLEKNTITVNNPEKEGNPRMMRVSNKLATMINYLPRKSDRVFGDTLHKNLRITYGRLRNRAAEKLQNPKMRYITFHTFRHWKATMEYHKTKDILHVQKILGHRNIVNTLIYTQLIIFENEDYHSAVAATVQEARSLIEAGFEYVCTHEGIMIFRKRG